MWQRVKRAVRSPIRVLGLAPAGLLRCHQCRSAPERPRELERHEHHDGAIGVVLFAFLIRIAVRGFDALDVEDLAARAVGRAHTSPRTRRLLSSFPLSVENVVRVLARLSILVLIGFFVVVGLVGLVDAMVTLQIKAVFWLMVLALSAFLLVIALGAFRLQDERDGRSPPASSESP